MAVVPFVMALLSALSRGGDSGDGGFACDGGGAYVGCLAWKNDRMEGCDAASGLAEGRDMVISYEIIQRTGKKGRKMKR